MTNLLTNYLYMSAEIGIMGLGPEAKKLSLLFAQKGYKLAIYNNDPDGLKDSLSDDFINEHAELKTARGYEQFGSFLNYIEEPRVIFFFPDHEDELKFEAWQWLEKLAPYDTVIISGSVLFSCSDALKYIIERTQICFHDLYILPENQAGLSCIFGTNTKVSQEIKDHLKGLDCLTEVGKVNVSVCGSLGAGHYVGKISKAIRYVEQQCLHEIIKLLHYGFGKSAVEIIAIFEKWLVENPKNTILSTTIEELKNQSFQFKINIPEVSIRRMPETIIYTSYSMFQSLFSYTTTFPEDERMNLQKAYTFNSTSSNTQTTPNILIDEVKHAFQAAQLVNLYQALSVSEGKTSHLKFSFSEVFRIYSSSVLTNSGTLDQVTLKAKENLLLQDEIKILLRSYSPYLIQTVSSALFLGIPVPCLSAAIQSLQSNTQGNLKLNYPPKKEALEPLSNRFDSSNHSIA